MNAIGYVRVSTSDQAENGQSLAAQRHAIEGAAKRLGVSVSAWHSDEGLSGGSGIDKRPGLLAALDAVKRGDVLLVAKRDRLARDALLSAWLEKETAKRGARIVSAAGEGTDSDEPTAILMRRVIDAFAEFERLVIKARTKAALAVKRRNCERISRHAPYGWTLGEHGKQEPIEAEQRVLTRLRGWKTRGWSLGRMARTLNEEGTPAKRGGKWRHQAIAGIFRRDGK